MLYTLLVGRPPFDTNEVKSTLNRVVTANYHLPTHLSLEAKDLIDKLLKKNPAERINLQDLCNHPFIAKFSNISGFTRLEHPSSSIDSGILTLSSGKISARFLTSHNGRVYFVF